MRHDIHALLVVLMACGPEASEKSHTPPGATTDPGTPDDDRTPVTPDVPDSVEVGDFSIRGLLLADRTDEPVTDGLCVEAVDQKDLALGIGPDVVAETTADAAGMFVLDGLPVTSTVGLVLRVRTCDGDTSRWYPTMTILPVESLAGLGRGEQLDGQIAWVVRTSDARAVEQGMLENGAPTGLDEAGAIFGQVFDTEGDPLPVAAIRGPDATRVHYDQGAGIWLPFVNTTEAGDGRFASPGAPWALWTCRSQAFNIPPMLTGASPGWITRWDFRATEDFTDGG